MFNFTFDPSIGVLRVIAAGFWSVDEVEAYCDAMELETDRARAQTGGVRLLIDVREHGVQSPEVMERMIRARRASLKKPEDRVAIVLAVGLAAAQSKRIIRKHGNERTDPGTSELFESMDSALAWLKAEGTGRAAA